MNTLNVSILTALLIVTVLIVLLLIMIPGKKRCKYCHDEAVVKAITYKNKNIYMCSNCLRAFRFMERKCFKSIMPIKKED